MAAERDNLETSEDAVLGGRLRLRQPLAGHRVGHDAILLAAATAGRAGEQAVDLGAGVGAAGLALAARVAGLKVTLVEIDAALARLAADNARAQSARRARDARLPATPRTSTRWPPPDLRAGSADRVLMNPPFHDATPAQCLARCAPPSRACRRARAAVALDRSPPRSCSSRGGVLTLIWRADEAGRRAGGAGARDSAPSPCCRSRRARARRRSACWCARSRAAAARRPIDPRSILNDAQGRPTAAARSRAARRTNVNACRGVKRRLRRPPKICAGGARIRASAGRPTGAACGVRFSSLRCESPTTVPISRNSKVSLGSIESPLSKPAWSGRDCNAKTIPRRNKGRFMAIPGTKVNCAAALTPPSRTA